MKIELIRSARVYKIWYSVDQMAEDLGSRTFELEPGDKLFVRDWDRPRLSVVRDRPPLNLVPAI